MNHERIAESCDVGSGGHWMLKTPFLCMVVNLYLKVMNRICSECRAESEPGVLLLFLLCSKCYRMEENATPVSALSHQGGQNPINLSALKPFV